jgi:vanillate/3-O-methylgallate O-demethylase
MFDTFISGPDATRLLTAVSANNYESFAIGQAKRLTHEVAPGFIGPPGMVMRETAAARLLTPNLR